jgi:hypothetical protein
MEGDRQVLSCVLGNLRYPPATPIVKDSGNYVIFRFYYSLGWEFDYSLAPSLPC